MASSGLLVEKSSKKSAESWLSSFLEKNNFYNFYRYFIAHRKTLVMETWSKHYITKIVFTFEHYPTKLFLHLLLIGRHNLYTYLQWKAIDLFVSDSEIWIAGISDIGITIMCWYSDGTLFRPQGSFCILTTTLMDACVQHMEKSGINCSIRWTSNGLHGNIHYINHRVGVPSRRGASTRQ